MFHPMFDEYKRQNNSRANRLDSSHDNREELAVEVEKLIEQILKAIAVVPKAGEEIGKALQDTISNALDRPSSRNRLTMR